VTTVLIIDDEVHIRRLVTRMLRLAGYDTMEAANGLQGLQLVAERQPDIVTCDIAMPIMDGYDFLLEIRHNPDTRNIPVVMITAMGQEDEVERALEIGANAFLTKPFSSSHLVKVISSQLEGYQTIQS
jgi:two-component system phosphate regulon response regulator PhoB